jgi:dolichol-phosphate mannosyltransferase
MISVVIPTYNEALLIEDCLRRSAAALRAAREEFELLVVDDASADGTAEIAESLAREVPVRVLRRPGRLGLATAVMDGWSMARGEVLGVIDADLQHPPETLTPLAGAMQQGADLAIGSRYVPGGGTSDWTRLRKFISQTATHMAATVLPLKLATVGDPMSGIFMVRKSVLEGAALNPLGYKILLEVIAKGHYKNLVEVPYVFQERERGASKLGARQYIEYLEHLLRLAFKTSQFQGWVRYSTVALAGGVIDVVMYSTLVTARLLPLPLALALAIQTALMSNFIFNEIFTFRSAEASWFRNGAPLRLARYEKVCLPSATVNFLITLFAAWRNLPPPAAAAVGVLAGGALNLLLNLPAIWRTWAPPRTLVSLRSRVRNE